MIDAANAHHARPHRPQGDALADRRESPHEGPLRVDVLADSVADVVMSAGGWLFDRARGGWAVTVFLDTDEDVAPIEILGARAVPLAGFADLPPDNGRPHMLAASNEMFHGDNRTRSETAVFKRAAGRMVVWGTPLPTGLDHKLGTLHHHLSNAAIVFKRHAMRAIGVEQTRVTPVEGFRGRVKVLGVCDSDLVPIAAAHRSLPATNFGDDAASRVSVTR